VDTNLTEIVVVLDRSGSMAPLTDDTIGGFNAFIEKQKQEPGSARLTTVLFYDKYDILHDNIDLKVVLPITGKEYFARGMTALLDAVGKTINTVGDQLAKMAEAERPARVLFVITTDGEENSSEEFTLEQIKQMVEHQTNVYKWQFIFLGAGINAFAAGHGMGINMVSNYVPDAAGTQRLYGTISDVAASYRSQGHIRKDWDKALKDPKKTP
jgi:uncharacterized protein YegL